MPPKLELDDYYTLLSAFEDAEASAISGLGGRHALLMMTLNQLGYKVRSVEEALRIARSLLEEGHV